MASTPINEYIAALLSDAAYTTAGTTATTAGDGKINLAAYGWADITETLQKTLGTNYFNNSQDGFTNEFRKFQNEGDHQIVFAYKGSKQLENWVSDLNLTDQGYSQYLSIEAAAQNYYYYIKNNSGPGRKFADYTVFTDGHSLGGGMAQCFAVQNGLSGFGQNSLPIPQGYIDNYNQYKQATSYGTFASDLAAETGRFDEVNVAGDIATFTYSTVLHGQYIDDHPRILSSVYPLIEIGGLALTLVPGLQSWGVQVALGAGFNAHRLAVLEPLLFETGIFSKTGGDNNIPLTADQATALANALQRVNSVSLNPDESISSTVDGTTGAVILPQLQASNSASQTITENAKGQINAIVAAGPNDSNLSAESGKNAKDTLLLSGSGNDTLIGAAGNDTLIGGFGNATLNGGNGNDYYEFVVPNGVKVVTQTIKDTDGKGSVWVFDGSDNKQLIGTSTESKKFEWVDKDGVTYKFTAPSSFDTNIGVLTINKGALGDGNQIVINNFDLTKARSKDGYLGIHLGMSDAVAARTIAAMPTNPFEDPNFNPDTAATPTSDMSDGSMGMYAVYLPEAAGETGQQIKIQLEGGDSSGLRVQVGNQILTTDNGSFTLTVQPGEKQAAFSILSESDVSSDQTYTVKATLIDATGQTTYQTHTVASITLKDQLKDVQTTVDVLGGFKPQNFGTDTQPEYRRDDLGNYIVDKSQALGIDDIDTLYSSDANTHIVGGQNHDSITAGSGNNLIEGHGGVDVIYGGSGKNQNYADVKVSMQDAINSAVPATGKQGSWFVGGCGDSLIVRDANNDVLMGNGNDTIVAGNGDNFIIGHTDRRTSSFNWISTHDMTFAGFNVSYLTSPAEMMSAPSQGGSVTIYAGNGNNHIWTGADENWLKGSGINFVKAGNGNNVIVAGAGDNNIIVGNGNNLIFGDDPQNPNFNQSEDYIEAGNGDNFIIGGGGDNTIIVGTGNNKIFSYAGNDYVEVQGGNGNDYIEVGEGDNTVFVGDGNDTVWAGDGNNYIETGDGDNVIEAGNGNNSVFAGDDSNHIVTGDGEDYIEVGDGNDSIQTGGGNNTIFAGDGNDEFALNGDNYLEVGDGDNVIKTGSGNNTIYTGDGKNSIQLGSGANTVYVGDVNDTILGGDGSVTVFGGDGIYEIHGGRVTA